MDYWNLWWLQWWKAAFQPWYVLDGLFDSFGKETLSDDGYVRNYVDVGELNNKTDRLVLIDIRTPVMTSYRIKPEQEQCTMLPV